MSRIFILIFALGIALARTAAAGEYVLEFVKGKPTANVDNPGDIYMKVAGQRFLIDKKAENEPSVVEPGEYAEKKIPKNAVFAIRWWWAGGGKDYYITRKDNVLQVFERWLDEGEGPAPKYKAVRKYTLAEKKP